MYHQAEEDIVIGSVDCKFCRVAVSGVVSDVEYAFISHSDES